MARYQVNSPGILMGFSSYVLWGFFPLYFYFLSEVSSTEVLAHRVVWSVAMLLLFLWWQGRHRSVFASLRSKKRVAVLTFASLMITGNWLIYIYAIATERTIDASMGYFINPIFLILLGLLFFKERLNRYQFICLFLAGAGIVYQWAALGGFSWISLSLPILFGLYGVVKKNLKLDSLASLFLETLIALPVAAVYLIILGVQGNLAFLTESSLLTVLLIGTGTVTTLPLLLFAGGARRLPLSTMGFLQYITPTLQFAIGLFVFGEALNFHKLVAFMFVWAGLLVLIAGQAFHVLRRG